MEFSIQQQKRCGRALFRAHRRGAFRVVFFAFLLPVFFFSLCGVFFCSSAAALSSARTGTATPACFLGAGIAAATLFLFLFALPVWLGAKRWYLEICSSNGLRIPSVFYYFSSFRLYGKAVWVGVSLFVFRMFLCLAAIVPPLVSILTAAAVFCRSGNELEQSLSLLCFLAGIGLLMCGAVSANRFGIRYAGVPWLLALDPAIPMRRLLKESARKKSVLALPLCRLRRNRLLSLGIFPAFWLLPAADCTMALWVCSHCASGRKNNTPSPFQKRKISKNRRFLLSDKHVF